MEAGPLRDLRVVDLGHDYSAPFAATLLADFGADVIKVEPPGAGDVMRDVGPSGPTGPIVWKSAGRNKKALGLDWKNPKSRPVLERLVRWADVLVESYRPGVLERNGLGPDVLLELNPDLVVLRVSGYGQTGPYSARPGFGKAGEAFSGLCDLTGFPDGPPTHAGFPMADMTTGLMGAYGVMLALHARQRGHARGQVIDLGLYETPLRLIDYHVPVRTGAGLLPKRNGNRHPLSMAMSGMYKTSDGKWITYSAGSCAVAKRVLRLVGGDRLADDPRFTDLRSICRHDNEIHGLMSEWFAARSATDALAGFREADAVAARIYDVDDILRDPHVAARENLVGFDGETCKVVNVVPKLSATPGRVRWPGRREVGADSVAILGQLGFEQGEIESLIGSGAVSVA
jgi:crotonobetainyl-CoA:carnitine CoA-transferase CaiB-like acyl-CoA transferase